MILNQTIVCSTNGGATPHVYITRTGQLSDVSIGSLRISYIIQLNHSVYRIIIHSYLLKKIANHGSTERKVCIQFIFLDRLRHVPSDL